MSASFPSSALHPSQPVNAIPNYHKAFINNAIIKTVENFEDPKKIHVAYIRGRKLFVIRPENWKGWNFLKQIWFLFNRLVFRYQHVDSEMITAHPLRNQTISIVKTEKYLDWLGKTYAVGEDKRYQFNALTSAKDNLQRDLDRVKRELEDKQAEIAKLEDHNSALLATMKKFKTTDAAQFEEIQRLEQVANSLSEKPLFDSTTHYDETIRELKRVIESDQDLFRRMKAYFVRSAEAHRVMSDKEIVDRLEELLLETGQIKLERIPKESRGLVARFLGLP